MADQMDNKQLTEQLAALADGELNAQEAAKLQAYLAEHPQAAGSVNLQRQLREAVSLAMREQAGQTPPALREKIEQLLTDIEPAADSDVPAPVSAQTAQQRNPIGWLGRWAPAAIAAMLLLGTFGVWVNFNRDRGLSITHAEHEIVPVSQLVMFGQRHIDCTREMAKLLTTINFSSDIAKLPAEVAQYTGGQPYGALDLSAMGYTFEAIGPCFVPGRDSVHMIYRADDGNAISLWMIKDQGQVPIAEDAFQICTADEAALEVTVWREKGMVYYLVADALPDALKAVTQLASR